MTAPFDIPDRIIVAIGGNATHPEDIEGTSREQKDIAALTAKALLPLALMENQLIITHGNGPVVGKILMRQALTRDVIAPMPLDICVAHSQGGIAYLLVQAIENALREVGNDRHAACLLTQVEVDPNDPAFQNPTKPIGTFYSEEEAKTVGAKMGWTMREDAGRGWRHVVPSPSPQHICDISLIDELSRRGSIVVAGGGGGIPVIRNPDGTRLGVEAVIDKDLTTAHMANVLGIDTMVMLTAVPQVMVDFGTPQARALSHVTASEMQAHLDAGQFPPGSMGPKIEAALRFLKGGGKRVIIAHLEEAGAALKGEAGTHVTADTDG